MHTESILKPHQQNILRNLYFTNLWSTTYRDGAMSCKGAFPGPARDIWCVLRYGGSNNDKPLQRSRHHWMPILRIWQACLSLSSFPKFLYLDYLSPWQVEWQRWYGDPLVFKNHGISPYGHTRRLGNMSWLSLNNITLVKLEALYDTWARSVFRTI